MRFYVYSQRYKVAVGYRFFMDSVPILVHTYPTRKSRETQWHNTKLVNKLKRLFTGRTKKNSIYTFLTFSSKTFGPEPRGLLWNSTSFVQKKLFYKVTKLQLRYAAMLFVQPLSRLSKRASKLRHFNNLIRSVFIILHRKSK